MSETVALGIAVTMVAGLIIVRFLLLLLQLRCCTRASKRR